MKKNGLYIGTSFVLDDEPCLGLYELNLKSPDQKSRRRYQIITVIRDDKRAEHRIDLGKATKVDQLRILGGGMDETTGRFWSEHTVGELKQMANQLRVESLFDKRELAQVNKVN